MKYVNGIVLENVIEAAAIEAVDSEFGTRALPLDWIGAQRLGGGLNITTY